MMRYGEEEVVNSLAQVKKRLYLGRKKALKAKESSILRYEPQISDSDYLETTVWAKEAGH